MSTLRPLADHIIVRPKKEDEVHKSGLIIPDSVSKERPQEGEVIAVGPGKRDESGKRIEPDVKSGDIVLFAKYGPTEVKVEDEDLLVLSESDVLAVVEK